MIMPRSPLLRIAQSQCDLTISIFDLSSRMDLSSPTEQSSYQYEDMQTSISSEEVYGRSQSSESSSSGRENQLRGIDRER